MNGADIIATLISLKQEVEAQTGTTIKLTVAGAAEAHLLAKEIGAANIGVILTPPRSYVRELLSTRSTHHNSHFGNASLAI